MSVNPSSRIQVSHCVVLQCLERSDNILVRLNFQSLHGSCSFCAICQISQCYNIASKHSAIVLRLFRFFHGFPFSDCSILDDFSTSRTIRLQFESFSQENLRNVSTKVRKRRRFDGKKVSVIQSPNFQS